MSLPPVQPRDVTLELPHCMRAVALERNFPFCSLGVSPGCKAVAAGMNPMDIKRGMDAATKVVLEDLAKQAVAIDSPESIRTLHFQPTQRFGAVDRSHRPGDGGGMAGARHGGVLSSCHARCGYYANRLEVATYQRMGQRRSIPPPRSASPDSIL